MILGIVDPGVFVISGLALNLTPGPDFAYIVAHGARHGARAGAVAALGIASGCLFHVLAATLGLSALLAASAQALTLVKWLGAAYLVYVGTRMALTRDVHVGPPPGVGPQAGAAAPGTVGDARLRRIFVNGLLTNVLNPKVALFFLAFLPQFVDPDADHQALAFLVLGLVFTMNGLLVCLAVGLLAGRASSRLGDSRIGLWLTRTIGAAMIVFGLRLAAWQR